MSATILRLGLWILVLVLALYVIHESYEDQPLAEMIPMQMLQNALVLSVGLIAVGLVVRLFEKTTKGAISKSRCRICHTPVAQGAIYCRQHLRNVLEREDRRTHNTRIR